MARNELALEIAESLELPEVLSHGLNTKGLILSARGRPEEAWLLMRHALEVALTHDLSSGRDSRLHQLHGTRLACGTGSARLSS